MTKYTMYFNANTPGNEKGTDVFNEIGLTRNSVDAIRFAITEVVDAFAQFGDNGCVITVGNAARLRKIWDRLESVPKRRDDRGIREDTDNLLSVVDEINMACLSRKNMGYVMPLTSISLASGYLKPIFDYIQDNWVSEEEN